MSPESCQGSQKQARGPKSRLEVPKGQRHPTEASQGAKEPFSWLQRAAKRPHRQVRGLKQVSRFRSRSEVQEDDQGLQKQDRGFQSAARSTRIKQEPLAGAQMIPAGPTSENGLC